MLNFLGRDSNTNNASELDYTPRLTFSNTNNFVLYAWNSDASNTNSASELDYKPRLTFSNMNNFVLYA